MSLFGNQNQPSGGLFGSSAANKPSPFGGFGSSTTNNQQQQQQQQPQQSGGLFGSTQTQQGGGGLFGSTATSQPQQTGGLFGSTAAAQPQQSGGLFGSTAPSQPQQGGGVFGSTATAQPQQQTGGLFGGAQSKPQSSLFGGGLGQQQQQQPQQQTGTSSLFGGTLGQNTQQPQQQQQQQQQPPFLGGMSMLSGQQQQAQQPQPQLGQTLNQSQLGSTLWSPGRGMTGVHRTVPMQMMILMDKWDPSKKDSPFRTYLYNNVGEEMAPFFQPTADDDEKKWEEALRKRPQPGFVPVVVKGFLELGKRAQKQKEFLTAMQSRLHEINDGLTGLLSRHDLQISVKIADCRRKHLVLSQRCLALASKTQVLKNRGYTMDDAEEELKKKLQQLERATFDPSFNGRAEEIWARMLAIREQSKRLELEMQKAGQNAADTADNALDEDVIKTAKKILEDYASQIHHLQKELTAVKEDFEASQSLDGNGTSRDTK